MNETKLLSRKFLSIIWHDHLCIYAIIQLKIIFKNPTSITPNDQFQDQIERNSAEIYHAKFEKIWWQNNPRGFLKHIFSTSLSCKVGNTIDSLLNTKAKIDPSYFQFTILKISLSISKKLLNLHKNWFLVFHRAF